jgi:hypothetical protein
MITGGCLCGEVRYEIDAPFESASYCHCTRCQRRSGTAASANGRTNESVFRIVKGAELVREFRPVDGSPKCFCSNCGSALWSRNAETGTLGVRLGTVDGDPGIRPQHRQFVDFAAVWEAIPDDGLPRFGGSAS